MPIDEILLALLQDFAVIRIVVEGAHLRAKTHGDVFLRDHFFGGFDGPSVGQGIDFNVGVFLSNPLGKFVDVTEHNAGFAILFLLFLASLAFAEIPAVILGNRKDIGGRVAFNEALGFGIDHVDGFKIGEARLAVFRPRISGSHVLGVPSGMEGKISIVRKQIFKGMNQITGSADISAEATVF